MISTDSFNRSHICSVLLKMTQKNMSFNRLDPGLHDCAKITFKHPGIKHNNQWPSQAGGDIFIYSCSQTVKTIEFKRNCEAFKALAVMIYTTRALNILPFQTLSTL